MTYQLYTPTGSTHNLTPIPVPDNAIDSALYDLSNKLGVLLVGRNAVDYGTAIAQNTVQMVSNFAGSVLPNDTISLQGQLWFNATSSTTGDLYVRKSSAGSGGIANWEQVVTGSGGNAPTASKLLNARNISTTGDALWTVSFDGSTNVSSTLTLASSGVTPGTYGSSGLVPIITVDVKGRITGVSTGAVSASAGALSGTTLAANVVNSSLTSVGILTSLETSGNVGIGGSATRTGLTVGNTSRTGENYVHAVSSTTDMFLGQSSATIFGFATGTIGLCFSNGATPVGFGTAAAQPVVFGTSAIERMRIAANGDVGIGITPSYKLDVAGTIHTSTYGIFPQGTYYNTSTVMGLNDNGANGLSFRTNGVDSRMILDGSGNVTVTSAGARLMVGSASLGSGLITAFKTGSVDVPIEATNTIASTAFGTNHSGSNNPWGAPTGTSYLGNQAVIPLVFTTAGAERVRFDSSGNVGIGVTAEAITRLHVHDATTCRIKLTTVASGTTSTDGFDIQFGNPDAYVWNREVGLLLFGTSNTERMRIDSAGNVGINSTAPFSPAGYTYVTVNNAVNGAGYTIYNGGTRTASFNMAAGNSSASIGTDANSFFTLYTNATERVRITSGGLVGIGKTPTTYALEVNGDVQATNFRGALIGNASTATTATTASTASTLATARNISTTGDASWTVSFDGSTNVSSALTLANSGVIASTYGSSSVIPIITVDSKGRITSVTTTGVNASTASTLATTRSITATGDASWSVNFDGSANVSAALTLANSGVGAGTYGSSSTIPIITVDAKGRITGASTTVVSSATTAFTLAGGVAGSAVYQSSTGSTGYTAAGTSGQVLTSNGAGAPTWSSGPASIGYNQTWQNVTGSRTSGTTYTNSTGRPIMMAVTMDNNAGTTIVIGGVTVLSLPAANVTVSGSYIIPPGNNYVMTTFIIDSWAELR